MALILKNLYNTYIWIFNEMADPRTNGIPLLSTVLNPVIIMLGYLYTVNILGPKLMENRKPFEIKNLIRVYNVLQVVINTYTFYLCLRRITVISWKCAEIDYSNSPTALDEIHVATVFYFVKVLDLVDTVFFVLRKSYRQVSFLHTYHHSAMVLCLWVGLRFFPGGNGLWLIFINSFVHIVMFSYYFVSTFDDKWKDIRLKKALTQLQLIQFAAFTFIFGRVLFQPTCNYPKFVSYMLVPQNMFMMLLFGDFYLKTYVFNKKIAEKKT